MSARTATHPLASPVLHPLQVTHDDKGNTCISFVEQVDVSRPERVQALMERALKQVRRQRGVVWGDWL